MFCTPPRIHRVPGGPAPAPGRPQRIDLGLESQHEALSVLAELTALRLRVAELEKDNEWLKGLLHDAYDDEEWDRQPTDDECEQPPLTPRASGRPYTPFPASQEDVPILQAPPQQRMWYVPDADAATSAAAAAAPLKLTPADHEQLQRQRARQALDALREPKPTTPPPVSPQPQRPAPRSWAQLVGGN